jgi:hypothetical protein
MKKKLKQKLPPKAAAHVAAQVHPAHDYFSKLVTDRPLTADELGTEADPDALPYEERMRFYRRRLGDALFHEVFKKQSGALSETEQLTRLNTILAREGFPSLRRNPALEPAAIEAEKQKREALRAAQDGGTKEEKKKAAFHGMLERKRVSHDDKTIQVLVAGNPRREGTVARRLYDAMAGCATVAEYRQKAEPIHRSALAYLLDSVKKKHIRLLEPGEKPVGQTPPAPPAAGTDADTGGAARKLASGRCPTTGAGAAGGVRTPKRPPAKQTAKKTGGKR